MTLAEALGGSRLADAERNAGGVTVLIHRSRQGYHLTPSTSGTAVFYNLKRGALTE